MSHSVRFPLGIFNWLRKQKRGVQGVPQSASALNVSSQIGRNYLLGANNAVNQGSVGSAQCDAYQAVNMAQGRGLFEVNEWGMVGVNNGQAGALSQGLGVVTHDGSYKLFKWDNAKGCMVPYEPSTPIVQRFQRSFDAFMRSWRLG